jgi:uncharacterized membrane protein YtjA (UPF0391 family)
MSRTIEANFLPSPVEEAKEKPRILSLIAGALGLFGVAAVASQISWVLFLVGIILLVVHLATGRGASRFSSRRWAQDG